MAKRSSVKTAGKVGRKVGKSAPKKSTSKKSTPKKSTPKKRAKPSTSSTIVTAAETAGAVIGRAVDTALTAVEGMVGRTGRKRAAKAKSKARTR
jgi:hypothetical protein